MLRKKYFFKLYFVVTLRELYILLVLELTMDLRLFMIYGNPKNTITSL